MAKPLSAGVVSAKRSDAGGVNRVDAKACGENFSSTDWLLKFRFDSKPGTDDSAYHCRPWYTIGSAFGRRLIRHSANASTGAKSVPSRSNKTQLPTSSPLMLTSSGNCWMRFALLSTEAGCCNLRGIVGVSGRELSALALASPGGAANLMGALSGRSTDEGAVSANTRELLDNKIKLHVSGSSVNV